jgi:hypothetical protein
LKESKEKREGRVRENSQMRHSALSLLSSSTVVLREYLLPRHYCDEKKWTEDDKQAILDRNVMVDAQSQEQFSKCEKYNSLWEILNWNQRQQRCINTDGCKFRGKYQMLGSCVPASQERSSTGARSFFVRGSPISGKKEVRKGLVGKKTREVADTTTNERSVAEAANVSDRFLSVDEESQSLVTTGSATMEKLDPNQPVAIYAEISQGEGDLSLPPLKILVKETIASNVVDSMRDSHTLAQVNPRTDSVQLSGIIYYNKAHMSVNLFSLI